MPVGVPVVLTPGTPNTTIRRICGWSIQENAGAVAEFTLATVGPSARITGKRFAAGDGQAVMSAAPIACPGGVLLTAVSGAVAGTVYAC